MIKARVAWVVGGGEGAGKAVALRLSASGVAVLVTGPEEKALGVCVGEMVHGGGKARHLVADERDPASAGAAVARAIDVFGGLDIVVASAGAAADVAFEAAKPKARPGSRFIALEPGEDPAAAAARVASICETR